MKFPTLTAVSGEANPASDGIMFIIRTCMPESRFKNRMPFRLTLHSFCLLLLLLLHGRNELVYDFADRLGGPHRGVLNDGYLPIPPGCQEEY